MRVSTGKYTIRRKERKATIHVYVLVWRSKDINLIKWRCAYICATRRKSLVWDMNAFSFLVFIVCHNEGTGNTTQWFFCAWVCASVCVWVRVCGRRVATTPGKPSWWPSTPSLLRKPRVGTWVPQDYRRWMWPTEEARLNHSEGLCMTAKIAGASSTRWSLRRQCQSSTVVAWSVGKTNVL